MSCCTKTQVSPVVHNHSPAVERRVLEPEVASISQPGAPDDGKQSVSSVKTNLTGIQQKVDDIVRKAYKAGKSAALIELRTKADFAFAESHEYVVAITKSGIQHLYNVTIKQRGESG